LDKQGERIVQKGLDFEPFLDDGWFNDNHGQKTTDVLGYPTKAGFVKKGARLPNGRTAESNGWWAEGYLLNTSEGRRTWQLCQALGKSPRQLGFSIEGSVKQRSPANEAVITRAVVKNVAITHCPVNTGTSMHALAKALTASGSIGNPGSAPGEGFALRRESMAQSLSAQEGSNAEDEDEEAEGLNVAVAKADPPVPGFEIMDEVSLINEWAPILHRQLQEMKPPILSKAESRIIVSHRFPNLSLAEVDRIIDHAATSTD